MHQKVKRRLIKTLLCLSIGAAGIAIILHNLKENIIFFYPPSQVNQINFDNVVKVGGLVKEGSVQLTNNDIKFIITDNIADLNIYYKGALPALFREGQGIVATGKLIGNIFIASQLLTKHDENYMPPEVAKAMKDDIVSSPR
jgi:cytochrome c-type biogenesis protein CcmE